MVSLTERGLSLRQFPAEIHKRVIMRVARADKVDSSNFAGMYELPLFMTAPNHAGNKNRFERRHQACR